MNAEKVFESILSLSGKIDKKIENLEFQISETLKGRYSLLGAADLAEDLLQEVEEKTAFADDALKAIKKDVQVEDAYIQKAFDDARWLEESVAQVELLAQQYGYTPKTRPKIDDAFEQYQENKRQENQDSPESSDQGQPIGKDTPNLITCGLSKRTLGDLGYKFKDGTPQDISLLDEKGFTPNEANEYSANYSDSDSPLPIAKQSTKKAHALGIDQMSLVEISPGLVVRRPSSRITPSQTETPARPSTQDKEVSPFNLGLSLGDAKRIDKKTNSSETSAQNFDRSRIQRNQQDFSSKTPSMFAKSSDSSHLNEDYSPQMPALATVNIQKILNQANQGLQRENNVQALDRPAKVDSSFLIATKPPPKEDSPNVPTLSTINIANLKIDSTPVYHKDYQSARREEPQTLKEEASPELPSLSTVNVRNLLKGYDLTKLSGKEN